MNVLLAVSCLGAAAAAPLWTLLLAPLLLGVPHVASDLACLSRLPAGPGRAFFAAAAALAVPWAGLSRPAETRDASLALAGFHGWLELAAATVLLARPAAAAP